ncbi:MAG: thiolase domain-containing protein [Acidimicrobiales bacterium]|nr:thiolase domain-containing protein [Acidimicrobiales bacterium]MCB9373197.1 thiolase domain-containing protein [Microthrixaceae bacterium]
MRDVAIVAFAQSKHERRIEGYNEIEMMMPVVGELWERTGLSADTVGFTCSGSTDFLAGQAFSFVTILDAIGPWPPISESHVEMDGAWALYEAWVKLQMGEIDTALVYSYGKSSPGDLPKVLTTQLEPYSVAPLWPDAISVAGLQARALLDSGRATEADLAGVAVRNRAHAKDNPKAQLAGDYTVEEILAEPYLANPLRKHDCPPITDGAAAVILAAGDVARELNDRPAWIRGIDHRVEAHALGARDLTRSASTRLAGEKAGVGDAPVDFAELHAPFTHQELIVAEALGLGDDVTVNPSGGPLAANPVMAAGLIRLGEAAERLSRGEGDRAVAHATSGPCLQQNLVCVLEGEG